MKKEKLKSLIINTIKLVVGIGLLALLIFHDNTGKKVLDVFSQFNWNIVLLIVLNGILMNLVSTMKWNLFLKERGHKISISRLFNLYMIGKFFNNFVPSMIGGDISRIYLLGKQIDSNSKSAASVFLERFTGLLAMIVLAIIFSIINFRILQEPLIGISVLIIVLGCLTLLILIYKPEIFNWFEKIFNKFPFGNKLFRKIRGLINDIAYFKEKPKVITSAMIYSFIFHIQTSIAVYLCCIAIDFYPSFLDIAVVTPIILLVVTIPVSPNNIGWWEWAFSVLLLETGAVAAQGLAVAFILRGATFLFALYGGVLFMFERINKKQSQIEKKLKVQNLK